MSFQLNTFDCLCVVNGSEVKSEYLSIKRQGESLSCVISCCSLGLFSTRQNFPRGAQFFLIVSSKAELIKKRKIALRAENFAQWKQPLE